MSIKDYMGEIIAFASGGGLLSILGYFSQNKKDKTEEFEKHIQQWRALYEEVQQSLKDTRINERECEERYQRLTEEFNAMKITARYRDEEISELQKQMKSLKDSIARKNIKP